MTVTVGGSSITYTDASVQGIAAVSFKNRIINGAMNIIQGTTPTGTNPTITNQPNGPITYSAYFGDRYIVQVSGSPVSSMSALFTTGSGIFKNALQVSSGTGMTGAGTLYVTQRIESTNTYDLNSQTVTLQARIACSTATSVSWAVYKPSSTADTWQAPGASSNAATNGTLITSGTFSGVSSTAAVFSASFTLGASDATNGLAVTFSISTSAASQSMTITGIQLEKGSVASSFEVRPIGLELALCQRYSYVLNSPNSVLGYGASVSTSVMHVHVPFKVSMRIAPQLYSTSGTPTFNYYLGSTQTTSFVPSSITGVLSTTYGIVLAFTSSTAITTDRPVFMSWSNATGVLTISAEL